MSCHKNEKKISVPRPNFFTRLQQEAQEFFKALDRSDVLNFCSLQQFTPSFHGHSDTVNSDTVQEAQLPQRNSASAARDLGWLTDRAMHRTPRNRRGCISF